ncbi:tRNA lysidine(34) synthetase TilS [Rhodohalobacter halophilus]|uniref:tRNA lysidine(34) synthetase TilS n=1 Tax=Rhodohalobacter halophilus TaxID=1812810 RepID=UPI00083F9B4C|nr:tRNA lysidine(34) synthetase TilS [Rhodohalobacter halophilus]
MSKFESSPVAKAFQKSVDNLLPDSSKLIAGISGGPDSMALMYLLHRFEIDAVMVHCNYQLRGEESEKDQRLVEKMSVFWGFECVSVRLDKEISGANFQAWARDRRYEIFSDLKEEFEADFIVTAHHQDDQIETILQRILRGAGMQAWQGIQPLENQLWRPLLDLSKSDILTFVEELNIPYRIDGSNEESTYARNFLRHNWFPELHNFFPGWRENILKLPRRASEYELMAKELLSQTLNDGHSLDFDSFKNLPELIRPVILYQFIQREKAGVDPSSSLTQIAQQLTELQSGKAIQLSSKYEIMRDRDELVIRKTAGSTISQVVIKREDLQDLGAVYGVQFTIEKYSSSYESEALYLDLNKLSFPITVRQWKEGDRFQPLGMEGTQLISNHLTNRKISSAQKSEAFLIESFDETVSAVIFPHNTSDDQIGTVSETVRCSSDTEKVLVIRNT